MPFHEWSESRGWDGIQLLWIAELLRWVKPRLPAGYRAFVGSVPTVAIGVSERPDRLVRQWPEAATSPVPASDADGRSADEEPDEQIAVVTLDPEKAVYVAMSGRLIAAIELISPRNKDRIDARTTYLMRYLAYLYEGVHLLLVDVHRRPLPFSFADRIAEESTFANHRCRHRWR